MTKAVPSATQRPTDPNQRWANHDRRLGQIEFGTPIPAFRARLKDAPLTVVSGTSEQIAWTDWEISDRRFFDDTAGISGNLLDLIEILVPGVYSFTIGINWENFAGARMTALYDTWINTCEIGKVEGANGLGFAFGGALTLSIVTEVPSVWGASLINPPGQTQAYPFVVVAQDSGVSRDVESAVWEIYFLGSNGNTSLECW